MNKLISTISVFFVLCLALPVSACFAEESRIKYYAPCAACHLPNGAGIPGAFPPIANRLTTIAGLDGGRDYLMQVVSYGLTGMLSIKGNMYVGAMPGHKATMSAADIAEALNYIVFELGSDATTAAKIKAFTAEEVAGFQEAVGAATMQDTAKIRGDLKAKLADQWPD